MVRPEDEGGHGDERAVERLGLVDQAGEGEGRRQGVERGVGEVLDLEDCPGGRGGGVGGDGPAGALVP